MGVLLSRRAVVEGALLGVGEVLFARRVASAATVDGQHQPRLELPVIAENPTAVPVRVSVEHPMEPDHFIRSIEVLLEADPVPHKGTYRFTPGNGQAWVAFPMRSGTGGVVKAIAECSRHGRFVATREVRVASDGCATEGLATDRPGNPRLRLRPVAKLGQVVEVLAKIDHDSDTGLSLKGGRYVRERPEFFVKHLRVYIDRELISEFTFTSALSPNPIVRFPLKVRGPGVLRVVFDNNQGRQWEATEPIRPEG